MKKVLIICVFSLILTSCSLFQRHNDLEANESKAAAPQPWEGEVARLSTKVSALETKLDVISSNLDRIQMQRSQPIIEASNQPQTSIAAPVEVPEQPQVSASPERPQALPDSVRHISTQGNLEVEKEFRANMELFQKGKNLESSNGFSQLAKSYPTHLLASHSLYWAGEAAVRGEQLSLAIENWEELEKNYPRSAYLPDTLSGLSQAYRSQGNLAKAKEYRIALEKAFPKSPAALHFQQYSKGLTNEANEKKISKIKEEPKIPTFDENNADEAPGVD